jgi:hypothetical protein
MSHRKSDLGIPRPEKSAKVVLVNRRVAVIVTTAGTPTIRAAKAATSIIPIVFVIGGDPVRMQRVLRRHYLLRR